MNNPEIIFFASLYGLAVLAALGVLLLASISDFCTMTIPNRFPLALAALFMIAYGASSGLSHAGGEAMFASLKLHAIAFAVIFTITFVMFGLRVWGAGDSKLAASIGLWIGLKGIVPFLMVMAVAGVGLVLASWFIGRTKFSLGPLGADSWPVRVRSGAGVIPYGIAIAAGAVAAFFDLGYFNIHV